VTASFDLIAQPFVPCVLPSGPAAEYGLRDALVKAHEVSELRDPSPLVTIALHRLLLAILHAAYRGPEDKAARIKIYRAGRFEPAVVGAYFEKWKDRFDLFHEKYPFYQTAGFSTKEPSGINRLAQELARGNNAALFDHTTDDPPPMFSPAQAARALIAEQVYAIGGGKSDTGNTTHAPLVSGATVLVRGRTLFETLWLNLTVFDRDQIPIPTTEDDIPWWEKTASKPPNVSAPAPDGYLDYLTWQSRTLRLHPEEIDERTVVRRVFYAQGRKLDPKEALFDPMCAYRRDAKSGFPVVRFSEFRDLWRDSSAFFQFGESDQFRGPVTLHTLGKLIEDEVLPSSARYQFSTFGLCTDKAKVNFWRHETLPLPLHYLDEPALVDALQKAIARAEGVKDALRAGVYAAVAERLTASDEQKPDGKRVAAVIDSLAADRLYWSQLEEPFCRFMIALAETAPEQRDERAAQWFRDTLRPAAVAAFDGSVGRLDGGRMYRAVTRGRAVLHRQLAKLDKTLVPATPEEVPNAG
jgi:CRISPR system Cascade subunit CasA